MSSYDFSTLDGQLKMRYATKIVRAVPSTRVIQKLVPFSNADKVGDKFNMPVMLTEDAGFSYTDPNGGLVTLNDAVAAQMKNAEVSGAEIIERSAMTYSQLARSVAPGAAFQNTFDVVMKNMVDSSSKRVELAMLYGQVGIAKAASSANVNATSTNVTITAASWAAGIWSGLENTKVNFYNAGSLVSSGSDAIFTVSTVSTTSRVVKFTGTATGIAALDTAIAANPNVLDVFFQGAYGLEMAGLAKIIANTSTLFGIDAATYSLWKSNDITTSGSLTFAKIMDAVATCANRGLEEDVVVLVNPSAYQVLSNDQASLRKFDSSYDKNNGTNGFASLEFYGPSGVIKIVPHIYVKTGEAYVINPNDISRIGASDISFQTPGKNANNYQMFWDLPSQNGCELRLYTHQAIIAGRPAQMARLSGFTV